MTPRLRSRKNRPIHMGAYPTEKLRRAEGVLGPVPAFTPLDKRRGITAPCWMRSARVW